MSVSVCAFPMSTRSACLIWAFRSCTACSTPGTMSGVRESILPGWIWMPSCVKKTSHCLPWRARILSRILISWESPSSTRCVIRIFYRFWIWRRSRCLQRNVGMIVPLSSVAVPAPIIRNPLQTFSISSISVKARPSIVH